MDAWDPTELHELIHQLGQLRAELLCLDADSSDLLEQVAGPNVASACNLLHYVALRRHDLRRLQERLAALGLSSLGRAEGCVLATIDGVLDILHHLAARPGRAPKPPRPTTTYAGARALLEAHTEALLGPAPPQRAVRIMVTMPSEAATDYALVRGLLAGGMDCMRINCAHDDEEAWAAMIVHLRRAEAELGRRCRVLMDLPGPKLRTGALEPGPRVRKWRPRRDLCGRVTAPARIWLTPEDAPTPPPADADASLLLPAGWLARLRKRDRIRFRDARDARRSFRVVEEVGACRWAESSKTAYVATGTLLRAPSGDRAAVGELPAVAVPIVLKKGDTLVLTRDPAPGGPARLTKHGKIAAPARIPCTLPEVYVDIRPGEPVWLDDGKIGGVVRRVEKDHVHVEVRQARPKGEKLGADKGINLPDTALRLPALTEEDAALLPFVAAHADLVGLSFVHCADDVTELQGRLAALGGRDLGVVLKIETRRGFERLPEILLAALRSSCVGVMIARGDLAVECGYERLAELQEEILWVCEAAHVPVIWATQVLEGLAKDGVPSRAEITDAAMGERAECVMLNKGPHIREAIRVLDDILRRMQGHQHKKRAMLRQLHLADQFHLGAASP